MARDVGLPVGEDAEQPLGDGQVPVGLRSGRDLRRVVGPYFQIGLIESSPPIRAVTPKTMKKNPPDFAAYTGRNG